MKRVICVGNRYKPEDAAGPLVYEYLRQAPLPPDVEVIDGALAGLDLLRLLEQTERVVLVDAVSGSDPQSKVVVLTSAEVEQDGSDVYDHSAGLPYLLRAWRRVTDGPLPEILLVGIAGPADHATVVAAAELSLSIAAEGDAPGRARAAHGVGAGS